MNDIPNYQKNQVIVSLYPNLSATTRSLISFEELKQMVITPTSTAKNETALIVPTDAPGKTKEVILQHNNMSINWIDVDENDKSLDEVINLCKTFQITNAIIYSTSSAMRIKDGVMQGHKWRILIPLSHALSCEHWLILQQALTNIFDACSSAVRIQQGLFAPTNPDGNYYEHVIIEGEVLNADTLTVPLLEVVNQIQAEKQAEEQLRIEQANNAPFKVREVNDKNAGIIGMYNSKISVEHVLQKNGYRKIGNKYIHPKSTSGIAGLITLPNGRAFSHNANDLLHGKYSLDAFDIYAILEHCGDYSKAVAQAANNLDREANQERRREWLKNQEALTPSPSPDRPLQGKSESLFIDGNDLKTVRTNIDYIIHGIIEENTTGLIFGPSGGAKTFNALNMALCVSTGIPWNDLATKKGLVPYFCGEGHQGASRRVKAWSKKNANPDLSNFIISKQTVNIETDIQRIIDEIESIVTLKGLSPVFIVIDTLARHLFGDENSSKDMMKFIALIDKLRGHFIGCSILIVHHTGNDSENMHRARGSSALKAAMDFEILCNKGILTFTKMKDSETPKPIEFKLIPVEIGINELCEEITSCIVEYGERSERNKATNFTRNEAIGIRALIEVSAKENRLINNKYVATTEAWREQFYSIRRAEDSEVKQDALKKAFQNMIKGLITKNALDQVSTDSIIVFEKYQDRIKSAISTNNIKNTFLSTQRETGNNGNFPGLFPAV